MNNEFKLTDVLAAIDLDGKDVWEELTEEQKKSVGFFTLNRFISSVQGSRDLKEHYLVVGNERYNKNLFAIISKHPKLAWQSACSCSHDSRRIMYHEYIKMEKTKDKKTQLLLQFFPNMKLNDIETLAAITTNKDIKQYCEDLGWDKKDINAIKL